MVDIALDKDKPEVGFIGCDETTVFEFFGQRVTGKELKKALELVLKERES